jgi:hypothetical protein
VARVAKRDVGSGLEVNGSVSAAVVVLTPDCVSSNMTDSGPSLGTDTDKQVLRRLDILVGLLAVVAAFLGILVAHTLSGSFVLAFLVIMLFGLGIIAVVRSVLD